MGNRAAAVVFVHEVRQIVGSLRFAFVFVALAVLLALTALPAATRFELEREEHKEVARAFEAALEAGTVGGFTDQRVPAVKPPWPLLFAVEGGQMATPNRYYQELSRLSLPRLAHTEDGEARLPAVPPLDWMLVVRVALSLAAFVLCHDAVSTEREARSSRLVWSQPVTRGQLLLGKFLAYQTCLALPVAVGAAASALLFSAATGVALAPVAGKLACVLALGLWILAIYVLVALWFASHIREAATCLTVLLFTWVASVVVAPAVADIAARRLAPLPSEVAVKRHLEKIYDDVHAELAGRSERWRGKAGAVDGFAGEKLSLRAANVTYTRQEEFWRQVLRGRLDQARLARDLASVSPAYLVQGVAERLAGTGLGREHSFLEQVRYYRVMLAATIRAMDLQDPESHHFYFVSDYLSKRRLPAGGIDTFAFRELTLCEGLAASWRVLLVLLGETLLLAWATRRAFVNQAVG